MEIGIPPEAYAAHARAKGFEAFVRRQLDATLEPRGFALVSQASLPVEPSEGDFRPASALYEYAPGPDAYVRRYPTITKGIEVEHIRCIDLWLHLDNDGRIRCDLEGRTLEDLLQTGGHGDELDAYRQTPLGEIQQLEAVARGLRVVLDAARVD